LTIFKNQSLRTMTTRILIAAIALSTLNPQLSTCFAQGSLTPPGTPAPTMKTLAQIEARTPISSAPFTLSASGSYYLTTNLTVSSGNAITITANNVTLDLNGFTIRSTAVAAAGTAILLSGGSASIAIYHGHISSGVTNTAAGVFGGGGFANGIYYSGNAPDNVRVKDVSVAGVLNYGIHLHTGNSTTVEFCTVAVAGFDGIEANNVSDSTARNCGSFGINAVTANNCSGDSVGNTGINATTANNCSGTSSGSGTGLYANNAINCYGTSSGSGYGLNATTANNCVGQSSSGYGVFVTIANNCYGSSSSGTGLYAFIASVCHGSTTSGTALSATHNVNSF
jgi:hypothetical protein